MSSALQTIARFIDDRWPDGDAYGRAAELIAALDEAGLAIVRTDAIADATTALRAENPSSDPDDLYAVMQHVADSLSATLSR